MNKRRELLFALGGSALTIPAVSFPQHQSKVWRVGFLSPRARPPSLESDFYGAFPRGMHELGYVEGQNLTIEWRFSDGENARLPALATELVRSVVDVIVTVGVPATIAANNASSTIPIVMGNVSDPVGSGLIKSLSRPGGNVTGHAIMTSEVSPKLLEMLESIVPKLKRIAVLVKPDNPARLFLLKEVQTTAEKRGVNVIQTDAMTQGALARAFEIMARRKADALIVQIDPTFIQLRQHIANLAFQYRLPCISGYGEFADAGGLMGYGQSLTANFRRSAIYVDKILKGAKPSALPVEQPTKFELFINAKTAKGLKLKIPESLLISADKVIE